jgi:hypothetical protein
MDNQSKVSVPSKKGGLATNMTPNPVKPGGVGQVGGGSIKGFGGGIAHSSTTNTDRGITKDGGNIKAPAKGFSGGNLPGKV